MEENKKKYHKEITDVNDSLRFPLWEKGLTDKEIAEELGVTPNCISQWRRTRGLKANRKENLIGPVGRIGNREKADIRFYHDLQLEEIPEDSAETVKFVLTEKEYRNERIKKIMLLRYVDGKSLEEVGAAVHLSKQRIQVIVMDEITRIKRCDKKTRMIIKYGLSRYKEAMTLYERERAKELMELYREILEENSKIHK